jgi:hypothetical protein
MKKIFLALFLVCFVILLSPSSGRSTELTALWEYQESENLVGFRIYKSRVSGKYIKAFDKVCEVGKSARSCKFQIYGTGNFFFVATAYGGPMVGESDFSNEVIFTIPIIETPLMLQKPINFQVK